MQDYDLITLLLSVAAFEKYNGKTKLYADARALEYMRERSLEGIFSRGTREMEVPDTIDPAVFWAGGKLSALQMEELPSVMIDTDLIIWEDLTEMLKGKQIAVIHREELREQIYPDPYSFAMKEEYRFPEDWDFSTLPANTAMLYLKDPDFRDSYVREAFRFMQSIRPTQDNLCPMVFAEQRILPTMAQAKGIAVYAFCDRIEQLREQHTFTHLWGHKNILKYNMDERRSFIRRCMKRLAGEFPEMYRTAAGLEEFEDYV